MDMFVIDFNKVYRGPDFPTLPIVRNCDERDLLELSIQKWEFVLEHYDEIHADGGSNTCALCMRYDPSGFVVPRCGGCPVRKATGQPGCVGSPFMKFHKATCADERYVAAAQELEFLKSLRKPEFYIGRDGAVKVDGFPEDMGVHEALEYSIRKWEIVCDHHPVVRHDGSNSTCGLCYLYYDDSCEGCPVYKATGQDSCLGTPYYYWTRSRLLEDAQAELEFLKSLRATLEDQA